MTDPMPRRPRVSVLSLLLLTAVVALGATVALLWSEVAPLRAENRRLRDEVGELSISDPTKLHAIRVDAGEPRSWKWRVWVPEGRTYRVHLVDRDIPSRGFPAEDGSLNLDRAGEQAMTFTIRRVADGDGWKATLSGGGGSLSTGGSDLDWAGERGVSHSAGVGKSTQVFPNEEPAVLIRYRASSVADARNGFPDPATGFLIWLEPQ